MIQGVTESKHYIAEGLPNLRSSRKSTASFRIGARVMLCRCQLRIRVPVTCTYGVEPALDRVRCHAGDLGGMLEGHRIAKLPEHGLYCMNGEVVTQLTHAVPAVFYAAVDAAG